MFSNVRFLYINHFIFDSVKENDNIFHHTNNKVPIFHFKNVTNIWKRTVDYLPAGNYARVTVSSGPVYVKYAFGQRSD